ncbi:hypothetical protein QAD02_023587 [Eretmocerus hayati]|uniref:Uncharacterized protein n=1 Tax=Eretmocerus hayati TaxID=131215 RepID=A0ACC2PXW6_9HYME|nr:hypothetical protein QAD02_023587 [Eretmocerus hayati]
MSDSADSSDEAENMTNFVLVKVEEKNKAWDKINPFVVPINFISFEDEEILDEDDEVASERESFQSVYVRYPAPPIKKDDRDMIHGFVSRLDTIPPASWPQFKCTIINSAASFTDAQNLLKQLSPKKKNSPKKAPKRSKEVTRKKLLALAKKDGLGRTLKPLADSVQNLIQPSKKPRLATESLGTAPSPSVNNPAQDTHMSTSNQEYTDGDSSVMDEPQVHHQSCTKEVEQLLFTPRSIEEILAQSSSKDHGHNLIPEENNSIESQRSLTSATAVHDQFNSSFGLDQSTTQFVTISLKQLQGNLENQRYPLSPLQLCIYNYRQFNFADLKQDIVSEVRDEIHKSEKRVKEKIDVKVKVLTNMMLRERNQQVSEVISWDDFKQKHSKFNFAINDLDQFTLFNNDLATNVDNIKTNLKIHIESTTAPTLDVRDNLDIIFQNAITKDVLTSHCASNSFNKKPTIKQTSFFKVVRDALFGLYNTPSTPDNKKINEDILCRCVGLIINSKRSSSGGKKNLPDPDQTQ